jgi:hypothetical protein
VQYDSSYNIALRLFSGEYERRRDREEVKGTEEEKREG